MGTAIRLGPADDVDLVPTDVDRQRDAGRVQHDRRQDLSRRRAHATDAIAIEHEPADGGVLEDARTARARRAGEALRRLDRIAVTRAGLVAAGDEVLRAQSRLQLTHL